MFEKIYIADDLSASDMFSDRDIRFLRCPKGLAKTEKILERIGYDLPLFISAGNCGDQHTALAARAKEFNEQRLGVTLPDKGFVLVSNATTKHNWMPFTAWMIVHRHHHGLVFETGARSSFPAIKSLEFELREIIKQSKINCLLEPLPARPWESVVSCIILSRLVNTRAGRTGILNCNSIDIAAELYAQLNFKGKITFSSVENGFWGKSRSYPASAHILAAAALDMKDDIDETVERHRPRIQAALEAEREIIFNSLLFM